MATQKLNTEKYAVPAVDKALDILEYLAKQALPKSQSDIAKAINRSANETYRVLIGLEARGYLIRDEQSGHYRISLKLYNLAHAISPIDQMRQGALPFMEDLTVDIGLSCHLNMLYQSKSMVIVQARSNMPISLNVAEGAIFPIRTSTSGLMLLANSNNAVREMMLSRDQAYLQLSKSAKLAYNQGLDEIKAMGFHRQNSQVSEAIIEFSALVGKPEGKVIAALSVFILPSQFNAKFDENRLRHKMIETANKIAEQLGC